jgi:hypothetical protein
MLLQEEKQKNKKEEEKDEEVGGGAGQSVSSLLVEYLEHAHDGQNRFLGIGFVVTYHSITIHYSVYNGTIPSFIS